MIQNPILPGFCPDPSIIRVGDDYFIAVSTFDWWPGVRIYHSKNLEHFQQLPSPLNRIEQLDMLGNGDSCGVWAPDLTYDGEYFWLIYTNDRTRNGNWFNTHNYLVKTKDIWSGEWSDPVYLNSTGFDPSLLHDTDGKKYVINMINQFKGNMVQEFDPVKMELVGEAKNVYPGTGLPFTEGPHIYHIGEYYYLMMAEGGTAYEHCETMARSKSIWGPYEPSPYNPVVTADIDNPEALQKCGHADIVQTQNGEWFLVHLASRPPAGTKLSVLGRETCLQNVYWTEDGWLRLKGDTHFGKWQAEEPVGLEKVMMPEVPARTDFGSIGLSTDNFVVDTKQESEDRKLKLGVEFSSLRIPAEWYASLSERPGYLRIHGQESLNSRFRVSLIARRQTDYLMTAETCVEFDPECPEQMAGLAYMYDTRNFFILAKTTDEEGYPMITLTKGNSGDVRVIAEPVYVDKDVDGIDKLSGATVDSKVYFRAETFDRGLKVKFYYSFDGENYVEIAEDATDILSDEHTVGFMGAHFGMYCHDMTGRRKAADFKYFELK